MIRSKAKFRRNRIIAMAWLTAFVAGFMIYWLIMVNYGILDFWDPTHAEKSERLSAPRQKPSGPAIVGGAGDFACRVWVEAGGGGGPSQRQQRPVDFQFRIERRGRLPPVRGPEATVWPTTLPQRVGIELMGPPMGRDDEMFADDRAGHARAAQRAR